VRTQRVAGHELCCDLLRQRGIQTAIHVDRRQLLAFVRVVSGQFPSLALHVRAFGVGLRAHRDVLTGSHRHRARNQPGDPGDQDVRVSRARRGDTHQQTRRRHDAVVRTQHGCA
jgi:hypothetical protein